MVNVNFATDTVVGEDNSEINTFSKKPSVIDMVGESKINEANAGAILCYPSGLYLDPTNPDPTRISIRDIAHSLSLIVRYTGHIPVHYTVAQHSLIVASIVPHTHRLAALLHDAEEAYIGDTSSPLKNSYERLFPGFKAVGNRLRETIFSALGVDYALYDDVVKAADSTVYLMERSSFWRQTAAISFMQPQEAEALFLNQFNILASLK